MYTYAHTYTHVHTHTHIHTYTHRAVALALARTCAAHYLAVPAAEALSRQPAALITAATASCARIITQQSAVPAAPPLKHLHPQVAGLSILRSGTNPTHAPAHSATPPSPSVPACVTEEHGGLMAANAVHTTLTLFSQIVAGLELPTHAATASLLLARAALFALHWSFAALPLQVRVGWGMCVGGGDGRGGLCLCSCGSECVRVCVCVCVRVCVCRTVPDIDYASGRLAGATLFVLYTSHLLRCSYRRVLEMCVLCALLMLV